MSIKITIEGGVASVNLSSIPVGVTVEITDNDGDEGEVICEYKGPPAVCGGVFGPSAIRGYEDENNLGVFPFAGLTDEQCQQAGRALEGYFMNEHPEIINMLAIEATKMLA